MKDCLFCKMIEGEIPCEKVFENKEVLGFKDIYPQAKEHYLFINKIHSNNVNEMEPIHTAQIFSAIKEFTTSNDLEKDGFRVVTNLGVNGRQSVFHTHFHVLGGETLGSFGT
ncbi:MAG: histidine triad (HIT) family protein [Bacteriovoracaceae bacterium]|jgi:histidine triad (HIT) family protein